MVKHAIEHGIKPTARVFMTTPKTVRKWVKRYEQDGYRALDDASRAPHHPPNQVTTEQYEEVLRLKKKHLSWGSERLKIEYNLAVLKKTYSGFFEKIDLSDLAEKRLRKGMTYEQ